MALMSGPLEAVRSERRWAAMTAGCLVRPMEHCWVIYSARLKDLPQDDQSVLSTADLMAS